MPEDEVDPEERILRVRFTADPSSVPGARRFVVDGLRAWGRDEIVDDAALCVSELAGNAALHGGNSYIEVGVLALDRAVRIFVEDDGPAPADVVVPRTDIPGLGVAADGLDLDAELDGLDELDLLLLDQPATGRGLAIISVLASDWGVEELEHGKRVWADLGSPDPDRERADDGITRATSRTPSPPASDGTLPPGWILVRLEGCPVDLSLRQDQHLDDLVRELILMSADHHNPASAELAKRLEAILRAPAHARLVGRRQAQLARDRGEHLVDVEMAIPREFSADVQELHQAVMAADTLCEEQRLLTLTSPADLRELRTWMTEEIVAQAERDASPVSWDTWRSRRSPR
ncbi:MAG TPA: ATP-binding protein [Nocardioidaceae bacterium]|nr:ATP-binding protein [Nocardioidaceae bacterium]